VRSTGGANGWAKPGEEQASLRFRHIRVLVQRHQNKRLQLADRKWVLLVRKWSAAERQFPKELRSSAAVPRHHVLEAQKALDGVSAKSLRSTTKSTRFQGIKECQI
jgi:hypothetical protein